MIELPDHGYGQFQLTPIDAGGVVAGSLGGPTDIIERPGYRYSISYFLNPLRARDDARIFQTKLEQGSRDDVSYPWPLDYRPPPAGVPLVNGASPAGAVIPIKGLLPGYAFRLGQPLAVISGGYGFIHRAAEPTVAANDGTVVLPVFPLTRRAFADNDVIEIERPRIRGVLTWEGTQQDASASRPFSFTITERL